MANDLREFNGDKLLEVAAKRRLAARGKDSGIRLSLEEVLSEEEYKRFIDIDPNDPPDDELFE